MNPLHCFLTACLLASPVLISAADAPKPAAKPQPAAKPAEPAPSFADVSFGPHPHQLLDIWLPKDGSGPFPVVLWYGGLWKPAKHSGNLGYFLSKHVAMVAVQSRTLDDAMADKVKEPISYPMEDACRAVQFVRLNAAKWNLDPNRIAVGGGSQGSLPALFVGCSGERADPKASDPVARVSTQVKGVAAFRSQPTIDPKQMQAWVPGVKWGAPSLGYDFDKSLAHYDEVLPIIQKWSPDHLIHQGCPPIYFENEWGLTPPGGDITEANYTVHAPMWGLGFKKLADKAGVTCYNKYLGQPSEKFADTWDFLVQQVTAPAS